MMRWIDSNIFLRMGEGQERAKAFIIKVENGRDKYQVASLVLSEVAWVLKSFKKLPLDEQVEYLSRILETANLKVVYKYEIKEALAVSKRTGVKISDCAIWSYMKKGDEIVSYDRDFDKLPDIKRVEP